MKDPRVQAMFKRSGHNNLSIFIVSQEYYKIPKRSIRANGSIFHIFRPKNFRDVQRLSQDKVPMAITLNEFNCPTNTCWDKKDQPLANDLSNENVIGRYRLG